MSIPLQVNYDIQQVCDDLGITLEELQALIHSKTNPDLPSMVKDSSLNDAIDLYLAHLGNLVTLGKRSPRTLDQYHNVLHRLKSYIAHRNLDISVLQLNEILLNEFFATLKPKKKNQLSPYTMNNYTGVIRGFLGFCFKKDLTNKDIRTHFEWTKAHLLPRYIPDSQIKQLLQASVQLVNGYRSHAMLSFLLGTGVRISEMLRLRVSDFDIEKKVIQIRQGKGRKDRYVPIFPEIEKIILDYLDLTGIKNWNRNNSDFLFAKNSAISGHSLRTPITKEAVEKMFRRLCLKLGFTEGYTVHSLRHTFSVSCLKAGMKVEYLSQILGHTDPKTTYVYIQLLPVDLGEELTNKFPFAFSKLLFQVLRSD
ncbi:tyrosine-type recombinase/integrase [Paenibacillus sp. WC2504]|uniref:tyrosine-type recombinase/integrase n=1 Tax=Paenibacillus sp. WC2504 TaxID=3461403 RepID=UPI0040451A68